MRNHLHQTRNVLEHALAVITLGRPLVETIARRDRELASQLRRALSSVALNLAEAAGNQAGNARLRHETALGSLYEARAALRVAVAWAHISAESAAETLEGLNTLGARVYGLARR
jgi:four helix bundle protein